MKKEPFVADFSRILEIEIDSRESIQLLELMLNVPFNIILTKNIYTYLNENYNEIKVSNILTDEEEKVLEEIKNNFDELIEAYDFVIDDLRPTPP